MKQGVTEYSTGVIAVKVSFPNHDVKCRWCQFCIDDTTMRQRRRCSLSEEILFDIDRMGVRCPLVFEEEEANEHGDL